MHGSSTSGSIGAIARALGLALAVATLALVAPACTPGALRDARPSDLVRAPYPRSRLVRAVVWDFSDMPAQRKALGSDLWPCAWAIDGDLYCAWGDGGGFDGNADNVGRVSLGFARIAGTPAVGDPSAITGVNIWGAPPYALVGANFGGKVGSMIAVDGVLYAVGGFWTADDSREPTRAGGRGPRTTIAWSVDSARSWQIADWSSPAPLGTFLDAGQDSSNQAASEVNQAAGEVLIYYLRNGDARNLYLRRTRREQLRADPASPGASEYFAGLTWWSRVPKWSSLESKATPVFTDRNNVEGPSAVYDAALGRYLLTAGHYASGNDDDSSAGQVGLFESPNPWGPWATIGYYEDWGGLKAETTGDYLSLRIPSKWLSPDGKSFWAVFSGLKSFDSFNLVRGELQLQ